VGALDNEKLSMKLRLITNPDIVKNKITPPPELGDVIDNKKVE